VPTQPNVSVAATVNTAAPVVVGVPVIWPSPASESPAGRLPDWIENTTGGVPPEPTRFTEYGAFTCASASVPGVTVITGQAMLIE